MSQNANNFFFFIAIVVLSIAIAVLSLRDAEAQTAGFISNNPADFVVSRIVTCP